VAQVIRLVVVVDADHERPDIEAFSKKRYAETLDGRRIEDPHWRVHTVSGCVFPSIRRAPEARAAEQHEVFVQTSGELGRNRLDSMVAAIRDAGIDATAAELQGLPIVVEVTEAADARMLDAAAGRLPAPPPRDVPLWARAGGRGCTVVAGAFLPRPLNRYRIWQSGSRRLRIISLLADWLVGAWAIGRRSGSPVPARRGVGRRVDRGSRDQD
jgi:hypothetical protein